jgi:hypothetical protein
LERGARDGDSPVREDDVFLVVEFLSNARPESSGVNLGAVVSVALGEASSSPLGQALVAKLKGFEGDACPECGNFTMVRNGTCLKCTTCGGTTGCS